MTASSLPSASLPPAASSVDQPSVFNWSHGGRKVRIAISDSGGAAGGAGPAWLLLPALSTISSRREWQPFCNAIAERPFPSAHRPRLIRIDWPGFGDSDRPRVPYDAELLARCLADLRREVCPADCGLIAAGHAAGIALLASGHPGLAFRDWVLVAPTWRGPLPTMAGRRSRAFPLLRRLVEAPLVGPVLYRANTSRGVLRWMSRRHVDVAGAGLTPEGIAERQRIARQRGARYASAAFVTGGLDPFADPEGWLQAARALPAPLTVVVADQAPPKSLAQMRALATVADRVLHLPGRLGAHEECGRELAKLMS